MEITIEGTQTKTKNIKTEKEYNLMLRLLKRGYTLDFNKFDDNLDIQLYSSNFSNYFFSFFINKKEYRKMVEELYKINCINYSEDITYLIDCLDKFEIIGKDDYNKDDYYKHNTVILHDNNILIEYK